MFQMNKVILKIEGGMVVISQPGPTRVEEIVFHKDQASVLASWLLTIHNMTQEQFDSEESLNA